MLLCAVNENTRGIVKLPTTESADGARTTESEVNAIQANAHLVQRVTDESLYWQICRNSMHTGSSWLISGAKSSVVQYRRNRALAELERTNLRDGFAMAKVGRPHPARSAARVQRAEWTARSALNHAAPGLRAEARGWRSAPALPSDGGVTRRRFSNATKHPARQRFSHHRKRCRAALATALQNGFIRASGIPFMLRSGIILPAILDTGPEGTEDGRRFNRTRFTRPFGGAGVDQMHSTVPPRLGQRATGSWR